MMNPATQPAYQASAVTDLTVFSELSSVVSPNASRPSLAAPVIERTHSAANDALSVAGTERELVAAHLPQGRRAPVLGALNPPESLCHYQRSLAGGRLAEGEVAPLCSEIRQGGFDGCPASGSCATPCGANAERPSDMLQWAAVSKFSKVSQWVVARAFLDAQFPGGAACVGKLFYGYDQGFFRLIDESELMQRLLQTFGYAIKVSDAQQMLKYVKVACRMSPDTFHSDARLLCFRNGTLNVETGELGRHSPDHRLVSRINADYLPAAECRRFRRFLEEIFRDDPDCEQRIRFLRQWMGYLLVPDASFQKMLFLLGRGANGKSVLCKVIEAMLGKENVSHAMLNRLGRAAVRVEMAGKLANISPDLPTQPLKEDGYLKAFVSGDPVEAERKYSDSCTINPYCRMMVATNSLPDTADRSDGFFRRVVILTFGRQFSRQEQDPGLLDELLGELDGIIAWAVDGLRELMGAGEFTIPPSSAQAVDDYRCEANPVQQFAEECLVGAASGGGMAAKDVFAVYSRWCAAHGQAHGTSIGFGRALANLGFQSRKSSHTIWLVSLSPSAGPYQSS